MAGYVTLVTLRISPDRMAEFESMMDAEAPLTRGFEGCELFEIYTTTTPGEVLFLEHWQSEEDSRSYGRWRTERGDMDRLGAFFTAPPEAIVMRRVAGTSVPA